MIIKPISQQQQQINDAAILNTESSTLYVIRILLYFCILSNQTQATRDNHVKLNIIVSNLGKALHNILMYKIVISLKCTHTQKRCEDERYLFCLNICPLSYNTTTYSYRLLSARFMLLKVSRV